MRGGPHAVRQLIQDGSGPYTIQVRGTIERSWAQEMRMRLSRQAGDREGISTLSGWLPDQSALLGTLRWLDMLGYLIIFVRYEYDAICPEHPKC